MSRWLQFNVGGWDGVAEERACIAWGTYWIERRFREWKAENDAKHEARLDAACVAAFGMDRAAFDELYGD